MIYPIDITTPGKPGELRNQIQGLVFARTWEFESPLRHQKLVQNSPEKAGITKKNVIPAFLVCPHKSKYQRGHLSKVLVFLLVAIPQQHFGAALYQHQKIVFIFCLLCTDFVG